MAKRKPKENKPAGKKRSFLKDAEGNIAMWVKVSGVLVPIIGAAVGIGRNLQITTDVNERTKELAVSVRDLQMTISRDHIIDSIMFKKQGQIIRRLGLDE